MGDEILHNLRLEEKLGIDFHHFLDQLLKMGVILWAGCLFHHGNPQHIMIGNIIGKTLQLLAESGKKLQIAFPTLDFLVLNDAVKPLT